MPLPILRLPAQPSVPPVARPITVVEPERREIPWVLAALFLHAGGWLGATMSLHDLRGIAREMRASIRDQLELEVSIEPAPPARAPEPEPPEPEAVPPPPVAPPPKVHDDPPAKEEESPYPDLPPAPAEATKVLTREADPVEKPAETFATGAGLGPGFGMVAGAGTGSSPTFSRHATVGGVPGGRGTQMPPKPPPDLSRPPSLLPNRDWGCDFPALADSEGLMGGLVRLVITVRPNGGAQAVKLVMDPGHGFGAEAYRCAMRQHYIPGRDRDGRPMTATIGPIGIRFTR